MSLWKKNKKALTIIGIYGLLLTVSFFCLIPITWTLVTSLKHDSVIMSYPPRWIPNPPTLQQYKKVIFLSNMPHYFMNSIFVACVAVAVTLLIACHAAYSVARFDFLGKNFLLFFILSTMMIARLANLVPLYLLASKLDLLDTYTILILVYSGWQIPMVVWLLKDFFETIPTSLEKAALLDGYSPLGAFYRVILPLSKPGMAAAAILVFMYVWNDFIIAITLTSSEKMRLVPPGLYMYISSWGIQWGELCAAVVLALFPVVVMFLILQRLFIMGLTAGAIKG